LRLSFFFARQKKKPHIAMMMTAPMAPTAMPVMAPSERVVVGAPVMIVAVVDALVVGDGLPEGVLVEMGYHVGIYGRH
jgi:hypothetical protein